MALQNLPFFLTIITMATVILNQNLVSSTTEFIFNTNFNSSSLLLVGDSTIQYSILCLTNDTSPLSTGRAFYPFKIATKSTNSSSLLPFSTSFIFSLPPDPFNGTGDGFAFAFLPSPGLTSTRQSRYMGLFNATSVGHSYNHIFAIEFDGATNVLFEDINGNHVGVDVNSLTSMASHVAGYWVGEGDKEFRELKLENGSNYQVWIDFLDSRINVTMAPAGQERPRRPLISEFVNVSGVLLGEMYVGFSGATGRRYGHRILAWSFSNTNFSIGDALVTQNLPSFLGRPICQPKWSNSGSERSVSRLISFILGVVVACGLLLVGCLLVVRYRKRKMKREEEIEDWEVEYWPHRIPYQEIYTATERFSEKNVVGFGSNGMIFKGVLPKGGVEVAVKRISLQHELGMKEFLSEISSLGRLKHRNLVGLKGWCNKDKASIILIYEYMENGSLDKRIFNCDKTMLLTWEERVKVLKDVASGILYLHEGWEAKVLHGDIKSNNVLLDKDMNAKLGDFGLARMHHHGQLASTTRVVGTVGYMAPELVQTGRTSTQTDVFSFGVLVLEVVCGRRPIEQGLPSLVDWLRRLLETGELLSAIDERLMTKGGYSLKEVEKLFYLGLLCVNPEPRGRLTMRQVVMVLESGFDVIDQGEEEGKTAKLIYGKTESTFMSRWSFGVRGANSTFEEIRHSLFSLVSLGESDFILEGR